jgi:hypothetical protein
MNLHANARTCPNSRELLARRVIEEDWSYARAAQAAGVSKRTVAKRVARRRRGESMADRSSAPRGALEDSRSKGRGDRAPSPPPDDRGRDRGDPRHSTSCSGSARGADCVSTKHARAGTRPREL